MKKRYRINKVKFSVFLIVAAISFAFFTSNVLGADRKAQDNFLEQAYDIVYVESGDSLWQIAKNNADKESDIRKLVYEICQANNIADHTIYPGDELLVPIITN